MSDENMPESTDMPEVILDGPKNNTPATRGSEAGVFL